MSVSEWLSASDPGAVGFVLGVLWMCLINIIIGIGGAND
jgi:hypothetical protein